MTFILSRRLRPAEFAVGLAGFLSGCSCSPVTITPPRVEQGGRALAIAVASNNDKRMIVATETGGLFRTFDGGKSWQHLDGLPNFKTIDVARASLAPDIIIATAQSQYRTMNDGGIWRSTDGGGTWTQPAGWTPPPGPACPSRPSAYGISHMPLSRTFYVGTDCGLAVSTDNGATWTTVIPDPAPLTSDSFQNKVHTALVINRTSGVAVGKRGLWHLDANGVWAKASSDPNNGDTPPTHGFAAPFWNPRAPIFFHASVGQKLWVSTDGGANWVQVPAPSANVREAFVRVARPLSGDESTFDVYYGDGMKMHRQTFSFDDPTTSGSWTNLKSDHNDPADIAFDLDRRVPILLATDGGVHLTADSGANWKLTGGNYGGFVALQIAEVTGRVVSAPTQHLDLYYGTQDNDLKASPDGGQTWPGSLCCEGRFIRIAGGADDDGTARVTGSQCGPCSNFSTQPHFEGGTGWPNAPGPSGPGVADAPFPITGDSYIQSVVVPGANPLIWDYFLTLSAGAAWAKSFSLMLQPRGPSIIAGSPANPIVYQGVQRPGSLPNGGTRFGLVRVSNLAGQAVVTRADSTGIGALGSLRTPIARYLAVGVDPRNPNRLIAPDADANEMKGSANGGVTWQSLPALTAAVTDSGRFRFMLGDNSLASVISWDPYDSCHILVGTIQNGIIRSTDGGNSWKRIDGSKPVTYVSSFFFPPTGKVWVSTNGRGLWTLDLNRQKVDDPGRCRFPIQGRIPADTTIVVDPTTGTAAPFRGLDDPAVCRDCSVIVVRNGWVTDLALAGDTLREIAISGGTVSQIDRSGREIPLAVPNVYRPGAGKLRSRTVDPAIGGLRRARGLVLEGTRIRSVIVAPADLPFAPARTPLVFALGRGERGTDAATPGAPVRVTGTGFLPGKPVRILFDRRVVADAVSVDADGSFSIEIPAPDQRGELLVLVEQRDGRRLTSERGTIDVVPPDEVDTRPTR